MAQPLLSSARLLLVLAIGLTINSQLPERYAVQIGRVLKPVVDTLLYPVQTPLYQMALSLSSPDDEGVPERTDMEKLIDDYAMALVEIDRLQQQRDEWRRKYEAASGAIALSNEPRRFVTVRVNGYTDTGTKPVLTLAGGKRLGIEAGQTVVWKESVVGRVIAPVGPMTADVELITGTNSALWVRIKAPFDEPGRDTPVRCRIEPSKDQTYFTTEVAKDEPVRAGDRVWLADELLYNDARGQIVGQVEKVIDYPQDPFLLNQVLIRPVIDLRRLPEVAVMIPLDK